MTLKPYLFLDVSEMTKNNQIQTSGKSSAKRYISVIAFHDVLLMDIAGPLQVFSSANHKMNEPVYEVRLVTLDGKSIRTDAGVELTADLSFTDTPPVGDFIIPGGPGINVSLQDPRYTEYLQGVLDGQKRIISVCSGSMLLAQTGLLDGKPATCHWERSPILHEKFPKVDWQLDEIFTSHDNIYCSAGVTAGIDLALFLLEQDFGRKLALEIAREMVVAMRRSGDQSQYSRFLAAQSSSSVQIQNLCSMIAKYPNKNWQLAKMSEVANVTERTLHRHFIREFGETPSRFVEGIRLDLAKTLLEQGNMNLEEIAVECGFRSEQTLRRAFARQLKVTPNEYRARFGFEDSSI